MSEERNELILKTIRRVVEEPGRNLLVYTDRVEHARKLCADLGSDFAVYTGGEKKSELEAALKSRHIIATFNIFKEGVDVESLNGIIFRTPRKEIVQMIGNCMLIATL